MQEGAPERDKQCDDGYADDHRPAHDRGGDGAPDPRFGRLPRAGPCPTDPERIDPRAEQHEHRGHDHDRAQHRENRNRDAGVGHRLEEEGREHQHHGEGHGNGGAAEQDGPAGRAHGGRNGIGTFRPRRELFPEPAHHQQGVVDAEAQPHSCGEVDRKDRDVGDATKDEKDGEPAEDADHADDQRQQRGDGATEGQDQQHHRDRDGHRLSHGEVLRDLAVDVLVDGRQTAGNNGNRTAAGRGLLVAGHKILGAVLVDDQGHNERMSAVLRP